MSLSIIIPVLNDADNLSGLLQLLSNNRGDIEIIVVDGGSNDNSREVASAFTDKVITSAPGRARQMNAGAAIANGSLLWFIHADSILPDHLAGFMQKQFADFHGWGFFKVCLSGRQVIFRVIETMMNFRSACTGIATGDLGVFISRQLFDDVGGYLEIPLMEDIAISTRLKKKQRPVIITKHQLITSSRRWEEQGILRTVFLMWRLRLAYFLGADPKLLVKEYY